ncbi:ABC transporter transmembrane domain-containing protein [Eilatimonas milleporae]|uniref:ATP-binding cassette subfamily B protein n=1 Tax=Eilatimonas milleporae TaxID=911205 RepID=A0A3M0CH68_9PROT|nr:ABC transporter transmembrane domain-containing protein [Eilatimonas milleporae]RMB07860.1 ATP-binding cassette subfamily B protein [Eilatimonas milleporae]
MSDTAIRQEHEPPKGRLTNLRTLWLYIRRYPLELSLAGFFLIISAVTVLIVPTAIQSIVDKGFTRAEAGAIEDHFFLFVIIVTVLAAATALRFFFVTWLGERVVADIRKAVYERLISLSPEFFETNSPGEIVSRLTADTTLVQTIVGSSMSVWARNFLIAIGGTVWLFVMNPKLMGLIAIVIPLVIATAIIVGRRVRTLSRRSQDRVADVGAKANESLAALSIVQAFTRESAEAERFGAQVDAAFSVARLRIMVRAALTGLLIFMIFGAIALVMYQGAQDVIAGKMTPGEILAFIMRAVFVAGAFGALSEIYSDLQRAAGAAGRLAELLSAESRIKAPAKPKALPQPVTGNIRFDDVTFAYPSKPGQAALTDFTLHVRPGETVALVGPSGAGKSTVLQLLLRFYDPDNGHVTIDGTNIADTDPTQFRRTLSFVPQDTIIFADSVAENIRYGRLEATRDEVVDAAKAAAAHDFIEASPDGFDTFLGERGTRLSGGQRQRIAIARALLRDAPILLLDEATSALDAESEQKVQQALTRLMKGRTTLVIAHRLATVKSVDRIVVMDQGRIVAEGRHDELVRQGGLYKRLADLQFGDV